MVLRARGIGEYYGVQGLTWKAPPLLDEPDRTVTRKGRKLRLYYDGRALRLVAWRTKRGVYWVSNTLTHSVGGAQMLEIAASLRLGSSSSAGPPAELSRRMSTTVSRSA